jgi:site-specific recombinase XerD
MRLEQQIAQKLRELSDTQLDRVACAYAALRFPHRFRFVDGRGFNAFDKPIAGRPDAFVVAADGTLDRIEVTGNSEKSKIKTAGLTSGHFVNILKSIKQKHPIGNAGGLVYIAGHPDIQFGPDEIELMRSAAEAAGLDINLVQIVGGDALKEALAAAEFAAVRIRLLGIEDPKRFKLVQSELGPDRRRLKNSNPFIPSREDLEAGRVHFPAAGHKVEACLKSDKLCLVKGVGASGKSVLAWLVGLRWGAAAAPAFVFNLQDTTDDPEANIRDCVEDLKVHASADALFIIDNVHLDEEGAREIYLEWRGLAPLQQPALLLLGRETRDRGGTGLAWLPITPVMLRAREAELQGVFRRLVERNGTGADSEVSAPPVPRAKLSAWLNTFGGDPDDPAATADLILFSAAVQQRMGELLAGDYRLTERDAADEVLKHYLRPLPNEERENLLELSVFQKLEITLDSRYLLNPISGFEHSIKDLGIVFEISLFKYRYKHFVSAHSSLSQLILVAANENASYEMSVFAQHARLSERASRKLVRGLLKAGRSDEAEKIQSIMMRSCDAYRDATIISWLQMFRSASASQDQEAVADFAAWVTGPNCEPILTVAAVKSPLHFLAHFLRYLEDAKSKELKSLHSRIASSLAAETNASALVANAVKSPLNDFTTFLRYLEGAKAAKLRGLYTSIASALANETSASTLLTNLINRPVEQITTFLRYLESAKAEKFRDLYTSIASALAGETNARMLAANAVRSPLHFLATFLRYLEGAKAERLRGLYTSIASALATETNASTLAANAVRSPLNDLTTFLRYLEGAKAAKLRGLYTSIASALAAETNASTLAANAVRSPLSDLMTFLRYLEGAKAAKLRGLYSSIASALATETNASTLVVNAIRKPINDLATFLRYLEGAKAESLRGLYTRMASELAGETNASMLAANAVKSPVEHLTHFLEYLEGAQSKEIKLLNDTLTKTLCDPNHSTVIAATALQGPAEHFSRFLSFAVVRDWLNPITKAAVDRCPAGSTHAEILSELCLALQMEAEILIEFGDVHTARAKQSQLSLLFGKFVEVS